MQGGDGRTKDRWARVPAPRTPYPAPAHLRDQPRSRVLDQPDESLEESGGGRAVDDAVVEGQAEAHPLPGDDLVSDHDRLPGDPAQAQYGALGRVDDRGERLDSEGPQVGDRERPPLQLV